MTREKILKARDLKVRFYTDEGQVNAVEGVDIDLYETDVLGIVGESGSGKSVTGLTIMGLIESPGRVDGGEIWYRNQSLVAEYESDPSVETDGDYVDILTLSDEARRRLRARSFSMVFQDPMESFDPSYTVGEQIAEAVEVQRRLADDTSGREYGLRELILSTVSNSYTFVSEQSRERAVELLEMVGLSDPEQRAQEYPHQFSGGMLQRAILAQALAADPDILIADEPTSALDVTIQAQILELLADIQEQTDMSIMLITHNLGVVARACEHVGVMYAGEIVEYAHIERILDEPEHPYTRGLMQSVPDIQVDDQQLRPISGNVPSLMDAEMGDHCYFADRCPEAKDECFAEKPPDVMLNDEHMSKCVLAEPDAQSITPDTIEQGGE
ncbi:ABC transporter ATP-binding protein [Salinadaptatus halalkaliphilus]|uniref:Nickel import system ATP-binding protein NikD n=1 Tax=Salinadaptatus halalkaliphilus TaxID=2419781 RepID=A0A4S3TGU8_9EURY|nr:ABC transporter ATP-binding protein [Salinadaptatus halalkaliphilus]THE63169.1 ABC transporter ATP-binding protein [Salinadaptatus halalkaliphilus]